MVDVAHTRCTVLLFGSRDDANARRDGIEAFANRMTATDQPLSLIRGSGSLDDAIDHARHPGGGMTGIGAWAPVVVVAEGWYRLPDASAGAGTPPLHRRTHILVLTVLRDRPAGQPSTMIDGP